MSVWKNINISVPRIKQVVDLWITGDADTIGFYDPSRKGHTSGRTTDWFFKDGKWHAVGGLGPHLSPEVRVTHWTPRPDPPQEVSA